MSVSSGNLDALLNASFPVDDYGGAAVQSFTTNGAFPPSLAIETVTLDTTGALGTGGVPGTTIKIAAVNDATNTITAVFLDAGTPIGQLTEFVIGYTADAILASTEDSELLAASNVGDFDNTLAVISPSPIASGTAITFDANGTFTGTLSCFARGTNIATTRGTMPVEDLRTGDLLPTLLGAPAPILWIGRRAVDCAHHPNPRNVWPVRIRAGAFGPALPARDLLLSPDHALYIDDVLIPVCHLVNGDNVAQLQVDRITYYHIELPRHDVLLAEGLPAESYLDTGGRRSFENAGGPMDLYPDFATRVWEAHGCAPLVVTGLKLLEIRERLARRSGTNLAA